MKRSFLVIVAVALAISAQAKPVDRQTATRAAVSFWEYTLGLNGGALLSDRSDDKWPYDHLLLFMMADGGFVLMSDNDVARPVLAYSASSTFDPENPPMALVPILEQYDLEIASVREGSTPADPDWQRLANGLAIKGSAKDGEVDSLGPLVQTQWSQLSPYNQLCPAGCPTGCVATAAAQVMRYWSYPAFGQGSHSYTSDGGYGVLSADFAHTLYDWENMPLHFSATSTAAERTAVATLMYHVGVSVQMGYNPMQSGAVAGDYAGDTNAYCSQNALWRYFRYNRQDLIYRDKGTMSNDDWTDLMVEELRQLRPILYNGRGSAGGHAFICDGFDSRRYLHFNLGNGGSGDGFYAIGAINYGTSYNFNMENNCVMGIHPEYGLYLSDPQLSIARLGGTSQVWLATCDTTAAPWTATTSADWITLSDTAFQRLGQVSVTATENTTGADRTATVTFSQLGFTAVLTVTQAAYDESDYCPLTVVMECTRAGSSWANNAHLSFESPSGLVYGTAAHTSTDRTSTATVRVAPGTLLIKYHHGGPQDRYYNYWVTNSFGDTLAAAVNAYYNAADVTVAYPCHPLGIDEGTPTVPTLAVAPNPASNSFTVSASEPMVRLSLMDIQGRLLGDWNHPGLKHAIDARALAGGVYIVVATTATGVSCHRVVVE